MEEEKNNNDASTDLARTENEEKASGKLQPNVGPRLPNVFEVCTPLSVLSGTTIAVILRYDLYSSLPPFFAVLLVFFLAFPLWWSFPVTPIMRWVPKLTVRLLLSAIVIVALGIATFWEYRLSKHIQTETVDYLVPAGDSYYQDQCSDSIPAGALVFYLGNSTAYIPLDSTEYQSRSPMTVLLTSNVPVLKLERVADGLFVSANIMSKDRQFALTVERNNLISSVSNSWYQFRSDKSTFAIYDEHDEEILYVRYMNSSAVKVRGVFGSPGKHTIVITASDIMIPSLNQTISKLCIGSIAGGYRF